MKIIRNKGVVYTGLVGANMGPKRHRNSTACKKVRHLCSGGPMAGEHLWLSTPATAYFMLHGQTGRYNNGKWESA